ncbi:MAG: hypothetical protein ACRDH2_20635, partial [Anaerolineales bacterium]
EAELLLFLDSDLMGLTPEHVRALLRPVSAGLADMTIGVFRGGRPHTDFSHWATPWLSGQRCLRRELFLRVSPATSGGYGIETAITLAARRQGWRGQQVVLGGVSHPPSEFHRGLWHGVRMRANMYGSILQTWRAERGWQLLVPHLSLRARLALMIVLVLLLGTGLIYNLSLASRLRLPDLLILPPEAMDLFW